MLEELNHSGYIVIKRKSENNENASCRYAYEFKDGCLLIYAYENIPEISGNIAIWGKGFDRVDYLFFASSKITDYWPDTPR